MLTLLSQIILKVTPNLYDTQYNFIISISESCVILDQISMQFDCIFDDDIDPPELTITPIGDGTDDVSGENDDYWLIEPKNN